MTYVSVVLQFEERKKTKKEEMHIVGLLLCLAFTSVAAGLHVRPATKKASLFRLLATIEPPVEENALTESICHEMDKSIKLAEIFQSSNKALVGSMKQLLSFYFNDRAYAYFAALEKIATVPYFAYTSVLHLYETLGLQSKKEVLELHFSETMNELHHSEIMKELGGDDEFKDRFISQHLAFFYYWIVVVLYVASPAMAYDLNKHIERHAYDTYNTYMIQNKQNLLSVKPPDSAVKYYKNKDIRSMYDVIKCIRDDELEHSNSMLKLQLEIEAEATMK